jgi:NAD(P)H-hydrate repair Nnr-like enzyme with NAD(P)H-hydrate dehydratase domain
MASGLSALEAGVAASWIHARAAEAASGGGPISAMDIADAVPAVVAELLLGGV